MNAMSLRTTYLISYNLVQFFGWLMLLAGTVHHVFKSGSHVGTYAKVQLPLKLFQTLAVLEVVHVLLGLVRSNFLMTALQVWSRVWMVWGVTDAIPQCQDGVGVLMYIMAWSVAEVVRYSFYALNLIGKSPQALLWCRYTFFIVLYPMGVLGEVLTVWLARPYIVKSRIFCLDLPNRANVSFDYHFFLWCMLFAYIPSFPRLYGHMLQQRRKFLHGSTDVQEKKTD